MGKGLSQIIFNNTNCFFDWIVSKLAKKIFLYQNND